MSFVEISVYPMVKEWFINFSYLYTSGQRVYIDISKHPGDSFATTLPNIGDSWSSDYPLLTLKEIKVDYIDNNPTCPKKYLCQYNTSPLAVYEFSGSPINIPVSAELSGNLDVYDNPKDGQPGAWYWHGNTKYAKDVRIPKVVYTETLVLTRYIYGNDLAKFHKEALFPCLNHTNKFPFLGTTGIAGQNTGDFTLIQWAPPTQGGFGKHTVLFTGANLQEQADQHNLKRWEAQLHFQVRCVPDFDGTCDPTSDNAKGWNYVYNIETGDYDYLTLAPNSTHYLYPEADFALLFNVGVPVIGQGATQIPSI